MQVLSREGRMDIQKKMAILELKLESRKWKISRYIGIDFSFIANKVLNFWPRLDIVYFGKLNDIFSGL